jgi:hypothetical protein
VRHTVDIINFDIKVPKIEKTEIVSHKSIRVKNGVVRMEGKGVNFIRLKAIE